LLSFVADLKSGAAEVAAPIYSHLVYDIVPGQHRVVRNPDILIIEGLNVLQGGETGTFVSDYFDFSIYVDARPEDIEHWYVDRFLTLRDTSFRDPSSYFHRYASFDDDEADIEGRRIWREINLANLQQNILHTRERATLILHKEADHRVSGVSLRRR
jgi:type I pantothenate kinase